MKKIIAGLLLSGFAVLILWTQPKIKESATVKIWDKNNILLYESAQTLGKKIPVGYAAFPRHLIEALVASEDESFWSNPGIDLKAVARSLFLNIKEKRVVSGASTITQQLARNSVISPQNKPSQSLIRKIREIFIALRLTATYPKKEILTMYLNQMYFGNLAYGIQAAASSYFDKDVSRLSLAESAFLVGLLSAPDSRNPFTSMNEAKNGQARVLDLMVKHGFIPKEKRDEAKKEELAITKEGVDIKAPHFVHYVLQELDSLGLGKDSGLNVHTSLDYPTYGLSEKIARIWIDKLKNKHDVSNASLVLINNDSGEIMNMLGGLDYFDASHAGQVNMVTALRQPGSALKPVTYAAAFMQGYTPATLIYDVKKVYKTKKGEGFTPNNYDGRYHGLVLAREALASSLNLPAVEMLDRVGIGNFVKVAKDLGITTFDQEDRYDLSITLGGGEVKLLELTNLFAGFGRGGLYKEPFSIQKVVADDGKVLFEHIEKQGTQVLGQNGKQIAYLITDILSDPKARLAGFGEKNPLVLSHPAAVKTGTTTDWHDNWTVGYTPDYTAGVWVGNNDNSPMREITGVVGAAPIWNQFFEEFLKGKPIKQFIRPQEITEKEVCAISGKLPDGLCSEKIIELFVKGQEPNETSALHKKVLIDKRNGLLADNSCPKNFTFEKIFVDYPPEVYTWAVQNNQEVMPEKSSPLCTDRQQYLGDSYLAITYPKDKTVFESAPLLLTDESVVFEVGVSGNIEKVDWYVDKTFYKQTADFPYSVSWTPKVGKHTIVAYGFTQDNQKVVSEEIGFTVVEFKEN